MFKREVKFEIIQGSTEHIARDGNRRRNPTVLLRVGRHSISWRAFQLGLFLCACQVMDGLLTYVGLRIHGIHMEGNIFLRHLMHAYGAFWALFLVKFVALGLVVILTVLSHRRRWLRPIIAFVCAIYLMLAVIPWVYIISTATAKSLAESEQAE